MEIPLEFRNELWCQKTRVKGLSCGVICMILRLAVLIQYRSVTDTHTHTDRQADRHTTTAYTALSKASRGKNRPNDSWHLWGILGPPTNSRLHVGLFVVQNLAAINAVCSLICKFLPHDAIC